MCCNGKCFGCIRVETGSMIFAVLNAVSSILTAVGCTIVIIIYYLQTHSTHNNGADGFNNSTLQYGDDISRNIFDYFFYISCGILVGVGLLNFVFSVILCVGIKKRNSAQIKAYFIYGIVMTVISCITILGLGFTSYLYFIIFAAPIVVYCFILHMIKMTMDKFASGEIYDFNHIRFKDTARIIKA